MQSLSPFPKVGPPCDPPKLRPTRSKNIYIEFRTIRSCGEIVGSISSPARLSASSAVLLSSLSILGFELEIRVVRFGPL
jgi:hypothetical protein